uniref:Uncharacterized protein n=1 Tax=Pyramimonas orientalis virus TaxID=455367 RepID=A0A7L9AZ06_POV01|nr:hypothetical protein HWQ62_00395 [Pyramimonas orientalis virus]
MTTSLSLILSGVLLVVCAFTLIKYFDLPDLYSNQLVKPNIFIYWDKGWKNAPYICKQCLRSWKKHNDKDFNIVELDDNNLSKWIRDETVLTTIKKIQTHKSTTQASDLLRLNLLANNGGLWVDATILCTQPLRSYIHTIKNKYGYWFPFDIDSKLQTNNFIYCEKNNKLFQKVTNAINLHFKDMSIEDVSDKSFLYIVSLTYDEFNKQIDWNVIRNKQFETASNKNKQGSKQLANSANLLLQPYSPQLFNKLNSQKYLKLTTRHGVSEFTSFPKNSIIYHLFQYHST